MWAVFINIYRVFLVIICLGYASSHNPPQLLENSGNSQRIVRPGILTILTCPVRGNKDTLIFEWYKDKESLAVYSGPRLRITSSGALKIKGTVFDDTGIYTCRAVNGFGSVEYNITLLILGEDEDYVHEEHMEKNEDYPVDLDESSHKISHLAKPRLLYVTEDERPLHMTSGSTLKLHCVSSGNPIPDMTWLKDGVQISRASRRGRWTIHIGRVTDIDAGNYTCIASNVLGSVSYSFIVTVDDSRGKPLLMGNEPSNTTVEEGETAVMQCTVQSISMPRIQWLKQMDQLQLHEDEKLNAIKMQGDYFRVVSSSEVVNRHDGSFYNKLILEDTRIVDAGKYVCLGTNIYGFSFRTAHLNVVLRTQTSTSSSIPLPIVVAVTIVTVAALAGVFALLVYCRNHHPQNSGSRGSSTAVPVVSKDDFLPMHQGPTHATRCALELPRRSQKHHATTTTVYLPSGEINEIF